MIKLMKLEKPVYKYGCVMLYFTFDEIQDIQSKIDTDDLYTENGSNQYGLETEPHVTLLYGLHDTVTLADVKSVLDQYTMYTCNFKDMSLFQNDNYDVLKFNVVGDNLHELNNDLTEYPYTTDYPKYNPHCTIAYLKPGRGKKYVEMFNDEEYWIAPTHAVYSQPSGKKDKISINID